MDKLRIAFLGPFFTFSHQAVQDAFGEDIILSPKSSFRDIFTSVQSTTVERAVVPLENSTNGAVIQILDLLADQDAEYKDVTVCGEHYLPVHHCLLVQRNEDEALLKNSGWSNMVKDPRKKLETITKLYTHPQVWGQCQIFLSKYLKQAQREDTESTAEAANVLSHLSGDDKHTCAAIASRFATENNGLSIVAANIEDFPQNVTRFLILRNSRQTACVKSSEWMKNRRLKALFTFTIKQEIPDGLSDALPIFGRYEFNIVNIDSRPDAVLPWHHVFLVECERRQESDHKNSGLEIENFMQELRQVTTTCKNWGSWLCGLNE